jgi:hypothetical protein
MIGGSKHLLLYMLDNSTNGKINDAVRRVVKSFSERKDFTRYPTLYDGVKKYIASNISGKWEVQVFKKKWVIYNDGGKIVSFYPNWTDDGNLDMNGKNNIRHSLGEAIFHKVDIFKFFPPAIINYTVVCKSGTELSVENIEMDHIRSIICHMNKNEISYE